MPVPLHVVAVDVVTGHELRLSNSPVLDAVLAGAAIPGVPEPVSWDGRALMDGGVANNAPISHAVELGAERIYVLPTGHACSLDEPPRGALAMALHAISLSRCWTLASSSTTAARRGSRSACACTGIRACLTWNPRA
jgi:NTE family protein